MRRSRPTLLSDLLERTLSRIGLDRRLDDFRVWQAWDEVVGQTISRNAQPVRLDGPRLVVAVRSSTWLQELRLLQGELIFRLNQWMGREVVSELFFVVGRVENTGPGGAGPRDSGASRKIAAGEPQGQRRRDQPWVAPQEDTPPTPEDLIPEVAATFERLWRAARSRPAPDNEDPDSD